jgi:hypothetical protein
VIYIYNLQFDIFHDYVIANAFAILCDYCFDYDATWCLLRLVVLWHLSKATICTFSCMCPLQLKNNWKIVVNFQVSNEWGADISSPLNVIKV